MTHPVARRSHASLDELPFVVEWRNFSSGIDELFRAKRARLHEAESACDLPLLSQCSINDSPILTVKYTVTPCHSINHLPTTSTEGLPGSLTGSLTGDIEGALTSSQRLLTVARRGRVRDTPMDMREANFLSEEDHALISEVPRVSLGRFRPLFVIYSRKMADVLDPQGVSIKSVYGNASTAEYLAHAQLLGIENIFYRLVLENAGLIPMHPGHQIFWEQEEHKRRKSSISGESRKLFFCVDITIYGYTNIRTNL